jgi:DNA-binding LytR/AlgR family response regulator
MLQPLSHQLLAESKFSVHQFDYTTPPIQLMLVTCVVFSDTSTVPDQVAQYLSSQPHIVERGVYTRMDDLEHALSSQSIDYILLDSGAAGKSLGALMARFAEVVRIVLVDGGGLFAVQTLPGLESDGGNEKPKRKSNEGTERLIPNAIYVRYDSRILRIALPDLGFVEAQKDYVVLNTLTGEHRILGSMKRIVSELGERDYYRIHRSFIVRLDRIERIEGEDLYLIGFEKPVPIGPSYRSQLLKTLRIL